MNSVKQASALLAKYGRNGDSNLVHMTPEEVTALQVMASGLGGTLTINPHTGLPEASFLKQALPMIAGVVAAPFTGGASLWGQMLAGGLVSGLTTKMMGGDSKAVLTNTLGGAAGAGLGAGLGAAGSGGTTATEGAVSTSTEAAATEGAVSTSTEAAATEAAATEATATEGSSAALSSAEGATGNIPVVDAQPVYTAGDTGLGAATEPGVGGVGQPSKLTQTLNSLQKPVGTAPPTVNNAPNALLGNKGKTLLGLGALAMGTDAHEQRRRDKAMKKQEAEDERDWNSRLDWVGSHSGPVNSRPMYRG